MIRFDKIPGCQFLNSMTTQELFKVVRKTTVKVGEFKLYFNGQWWNTGLRRG